MLFHVEQTHTPENCPIGQGGSQSLVDRKATGVKIVGSYGAFTEHVIYYILEADNIDAINAFLKPGMKKCVAKITPVSDHPIPV